MGLAGIDHQEGEEKTDETKLNCSLLNEGFPCCYPAAYLSVSGGCRSAAVNQVILILSLQESVTGGGERKNNDFFRLTYTK